MSRTLIKDDRALYEGIRQEKARRRALGSSDEPERLEGRPAELKMEWQRLRRERAARNIYHIVIEPADGHYRAYPLAAPEVVAVGDTPRQAKERVTEALRFHLAEMQARGQPLPIEDKLVETVVIPLA